MEVVEHELSHARERNVDTVLKRKSALAYNQAGAKYRDSNPEAREKTNLHTHWTHGLRIRFESGHSDHFKAGLAPKSPPHFPAYFSPMAHPRPWPVQPRSGSSSTRARLFVSASRSHSKPFGPYVPPLPREGSRSLPSSSRSFASSATADAIQVVRDHTIG